MAIAGDTDSEIIKAVEERYAKFPDQPFYASELGKLVKAKGLHVPPEVTIVNYLRSKFEDKLHIVQDPEVRSRIAIALPSNRDKIARLISRGSVAEAPEIEFRRLPFALIAAFCVPPMEGKKLYFPTRPPFRYQLANERPSESFVEIEEQFRPDEVREANVHSLSEDQRLIIYRSIIQWANAKTLNLADLYLSSSWTVGQKGAPQSQSVTRKNALERLIGAQDDDIKTRVKIPLDIAQLLMDTP